VNARVALAALDERLRTLLPEEYQESYEQVQPVSMGSAGLKYGADGNVAWDEMWQTFCDLAMAGGPPHKGTLLEPGSPGAIAANEERYRQVIGEIRRGIELVTGMPADPSPHRGWVRVECYSAAMAGWLVRAIVMENVAAQADGVTLDLPVAPHFRVEKEIKNVITVIAKTCHYWLEHMPRTQQRSIAGLFETMSAESPLLAPPRAGDDRERAVTTRVADRLEQQTGLTRSDQRYSGWLGMNCPTARTAIWMMRALVAANVLSRREGTTLFVPVNVETDPAGDLVVQALMRTHALAVARGAL
jgi:sirohydrochlorin cobaltochelatase